MARAEDLLELVRTRDLELIVSAVVRGPIAAPSLEDGSVAEPRALHVVVAYLAHALDSQRLPRQVLARAPPALSSRHARARFARVGPLAPGMSLERVLPQRRQLLDELPARVHRERRRHADVVQPMRPVVEAQHERTHQRVSPVLVPAEPGYDAVGRAGVLDLQHRALAWLVGGPCGLGDHAIETR